MHELQNTVIEFQGASAEKDALIESQHLIALLGGGIDNELEFQRSLKCRTDGTGQWLLEHSSFKEWYSFESPINLLWLYGPGKIVPLAT